MIRNLPAPMEDETLHSIFARYYESTIYTSAKKMLKDLLQRKAFGSMANIPLGISMVQEAFSLSDVELSNLMRHHSFLPYFTAFTAGEWKEKINHVVYSGVTDSATNFIISNPRVYNVIDLLFPLSSGKSREVWQKRMMAH